MRRLAAVLGLAIACSGPSEPKFGTTVEELSISYLQIDDGVAYVLFKLTDSRSRPVRTHGALIHEWIDNRATPPQRCTLEIRVTEDSYRDHYASYEVEGPLAGPCTPNPRLLPYAWWQPAAGPRLRATIAFLPTALIEKRFMWMAADDVDRAASEGLAELPEVSPP